MIYKYIGNIYHFLDFLINWIKLYSKIFLIKIIINKDIKLSKYC